MTIAFAKVTITTLQCIEQSQSFQKLEKKLIKMYLI